MLPALFRGKLSRDQENMEDVLTSNVFGLLRYVPHHKGLFQLLAMAEAIEATWGEGRFPLRELVTDQDSDGFDVEYEFWPFWTEPGCLACEPDLVIRIHDGRQRRWIVLIEAKYLSSKSSEADDTDDRPNDQLAREWDNLVHRAEEEHAEAHLIYLTASIGLPKDEIEASVGEYRLKRSHDSRRPSILALSWRQIGEVFRSSTHPILRDLVELNGRLGLTYFHGVHCCGLAGRWEWKFNHFPRRWIRTSEVRRVAWRFQA